MTETEQIEEIYNQYPRKVGRRAALKAIENAVKRMVKEVILDLGTPKERACDSLTARRMICKLTMLYAKSPAGQKPSDPAQDYRPHPATWFNQDRFFDDPAEWQKPNGGTSNGRQQIGTKTSRTIDALRAAIAKGSDHDRSGDTGNQEERGVRPGDAGDVCGRTIEGTL